MAIKIQIKAGRQCWLASVMHEWRQPKFKSKQGGSAGLHLSCMNGDNQNLNQSLEAVPACICHACDTTF